MDFRKWTNEMTIPIWYSLIICFNRTKMQQVFSSFLCLFWICYRQIICFTTNFPCLCCTFQVPFMLLLLVYQPSNKDSCSKYYKHDWKTSLCQNLTVLTNWLTENTTPVTPEMWHLTTIYTAGISSQKLYSPENPRYFLLLKNPDISTIHADVDAGTLCYNFPNK